MAAGVEVKIGADDSDFQEALKRTKAGLVKFRGDINESAKNFAKWGTAAAAAGVALGAAIVTNSAQSAKELDNLAKRANVSRREFQRLAAGARTVGIEQDKLSDIFLDMNDRVGDFVNSGAGPMVDFFEQIGPKVGVTAEHFRNLSGPQALQLYVSSLEKANLNQQDMTFFMEAIASDSTALLPLLRNNGKAMKEYGDRAEDLGVILSDIDSQKLIEAQKAMDDGLRLVKAFSNHMAVQFAPLIQAVSKLFREQAREVGGVGEAASNSFAGLIEVAGFVMNAFDGVTRVVKLSAIQIIRVIESAVQQALSTVHNLIKFIDDAPLIGRAVDFSETTKNLDLAFKRSVNVVKQANADMQKLLTEPLAGDRFKTYAEQARKAAEDSAAAFLDLEDLLNQGGGSGSTDRVDPSEQERLEKELANRIEKIREAAELEKRVRESVESGAAFALGREDDGELSLLEQQTNEKLALLQESYAKERELELMNWEQQQEDLKARLEAGKITQQDHDALLEESKRIHENKLTNIEKDAAKRREEIVKAEAEYKKKALGDALSSLSTLMNSESRKQFEIGKAAALSQAVIDGYAAVTGAYKVGASIGGPPVGAAFAAAAGLATYNQIQSIRNTQFQGGSGGNPSGGVAAAPVPSNTQQVNAQTEQVERLTSIDISLIGADSRDRAIAGSVIQQINDEIEAGGRINRVGLA